MTGTYLHCVRLAKTCLSHRSPRWTLRLHRKHVSTWSHLAATFNTKPSHRLNMKLSGKSTGLFGIDELRDPTGFYILKERATEDTNRLVAESCSPNRKRKMVTIFDEMSDTLCKVADMAEFVRIAHPDHKYAQAAEDASMSINALVERLNTNQDIYKALKNVIENGDIVPTDEVDKHVAKLFLFDFEQSGIHLDEHKRSRVVQLNDYILQTGAYFMHATSLPRAVEREKLPESIRACFPSQGDNVVVTGLCAESSNEMMRHAAYRIYMYPDAQQENRLQELLLAREELAHLCGFPTFAHRVLRGSLAESPDVVKDFLNALTKANFPYAKLDLETLLARKQQTNEFSKELHMWDTPYLSAVIKNETSAVDTSEFMQYFSLGTCMEGLNFLFKNLYGITLETQETDSAELWAPEVHKLAVVEQNGDILGYIYCDFLERSGKPNQDCHFTIRGGRELPDGSYQLPVVVLLLNFPKPSWMQPCLLNHAMIENLFHEMGHAMHSMLARTKYQHVTGTRCSTDFAEVPSVLMEYFASDPRVLAQFARNYKTGNNIPYDMLVKMYNAKSTLSANELQLQIFYAMLDQRYHGDVTNLKLQALAGEKGATTTDVIAEIQAQYYGIPHVPQTAWQLRFGHLVGYGGKYYSYLMSKAVASWIWQSYFQADPFNRNAGEKYRREILAHGGGRPPKELLENFLEAKVSPDALVHSLVSEIEAKQKNCNKSG